MAVRPAILRPRHGALGVERRIVTTIRAVEARVACRPCPIATFSVDYFHGGSTASKQMLDCLLGAAEGELVARFYVDDFEYVIEALLQRPDENVGRRREEVFFVALSLRSEAAS